MSGWRYRLTLYYGEDYGNSKKGDIAIQTVHTNLDNLAMDLKAAKSRPEIGLIVRLDLKTGEQKVLQHRFKR